MKHTDISHSFATNWLSKLSSAWVDNDIKLVEKLFFDCTEYFEAPFVDPAHDIQTIVSFWDEIKNHTDVNVETQIIAIDNMALVANYKAKYTCQSLKKESNGIYVVLFNNDLQCISFKQWSVVK